MGFKLLVWTRTSRSHDIAGPVHQVSVLVVLDGGACPGALQVSPRAGRVAAGHAASASASAAASVPASRAAHSHSVDMPRRAHRDRHDPSSVVPNNQNGTVARQTSDNWSGVSYMLLRGPRAGRRDGTEAGRDTPHIQTEHNHSHLSYGFRICVHPSFNKILCQNLLTLERYLQGFLLSFLSENILAQRKHMLVPIVSAKKLRTRKSILLKGCKSF